MGLNYDGINDLVKFWTRYEDKLIREINMEEKIGKIKDVKFGMGGYQDVMIGISITMGSDSECWGVSDFKGYWGMSIDITPNTKWTEQCRRDEYANTVIFISKILEEAKVKYIKNLIGKPVLVSFENSTLKGWRILTEAI